MSKLHHSDRLAQRVAPVQRAQADLETICRELDAATVLEGTVRKIGDKLRVSGRGGR